MQKEFCWEFYFLIYFFLECSLFCCDVIIFGNIFNYTWLILNAMFKILDVYNESSIKKEIFGIVLSELFYWTTFSLNLTNILPSLSYQILYFECTEFSTERLFFLPNLIWKFEVITLLFRVQKIQENNSKIFQLVFLVILAGFIFIS